MALLAAGCSSNEKDKTPIPLEGLWKITELIELEIPAEEENETDEQEGEADNQDDAVNGAPRLKNGATDDNNQVLADGAYLHLTGNTYSYFTLTEGVEEGWSSGSYLRTNNELVFTEVSGGTVQAQILELKANLLKLEMTFEERKEEWTLERIQLSTLPEEEEEEEESEFVDYEALYHDAQALEGSILNPYPLAESLNDTLQGILSYGEEESNPPVAEDFYFLKVDPKDSYRLTLSVAEPVYNYEKLPAAFMRYVQLWVGSQPFEDYFKADSLRINEGQERKPFDYEGLMSTTGFLYLRIFSLQDGIHYNMVLEKEDPAEEEQTNEEE